MCVNPYVYFSVSCCKLVYLLIYTLRYCRGFGATYVLARDIKISFTFQSEDSEDSVSVSFSAYLLSISNARCEQKCPIKCNSNPNSNLVRKITTCFRCENNLSNPGNRSRPTRSNQRARQRRAVKRRYNRSIAPVGPNRGAGFHCAAGWSKPSAGWPAPIRPGSTPAHPAAAPPSSGP